MVLQCIKLCYGCNCNNCSKFEQLFLRVRVCELADGAHIIQVELVAHGTGTEPGFEIWVWGSGNWQPGTGNWDLDLGLSCRDWQFHFTPSSLAAGGLSSGPVVSSLWRVWQAASAPASSFSYSLFPYLFCLGLLLFFSPFLVHPCHSRRHGIRALG